MPTITTVARLANVSVASASRVMNGIRTSPSTLERVIEAAEAVGYVPNAAARTLRSRRTGQIAFAMPDVGNPVYTTMISSIQNVAKARGWRLMLHSTGADMEDELAMVRDLKHRFVDGLILASLHLTDVHADELRRAAAPVILIGRPTTGTTVDTVRAYSRKGASEAVRHLYAAKRERIGFVNGPQHTAPGSSRRLGYLDGLRSCSLTRDDWLIEVAADFMIEPGRRATERLLDASAPTRSSARTTCWPSARWLRSAMQASMCRGDVALVGMDNTAALRGHLADADHGRPRFVRASQDRRGDAPRADRGSGTRAARRRGRAETRRARLLRHPVRGSGVSAVPEAGRPIYKRRKRSRAGAGISGREAILLLIPAMLPIVILSVIPLARGIYLGFTNSQAGLNFDTNFIGLDNFRTLIHDELFINSFKIGLLWSVAVTAIGFCFALGLALLLSQDLKGRGFARALALVPWAMPSVIVGIMWKLFFQPQAGILNEILRRFHIPGETTDWLSSFTWALPAVILVGVWAGMPQTTIALLAGLQSIQDELHEAAAVDGATAWQRFRTITLPQLRPVIIAITTLDFIWNFNSFGLVYVLTDGGPAGKTQLPMLFGYSQAFEYGQFGYAAALGCVMVLVISGLLVFYLWGRMKETR